MQPHPPLNFKEWKDRNETKQNSRKKEEKREKWSRITNTFVLILGLCTLIMCLKVFTSICVLDPIPPLENLWIRACNGYM